MRAPANWIHIDAKGMMPSEEKLGHWLAFFRKSGFTGIVWEYEDRLPWATFPGTFRPGWKLSAWQRIWQHCEGLGLEIIPLIQTYGHLEWLLRHESWSGLRCDGHINLLCPEHPETRPLLAAWIQETARLHPRSAFLHIGFDEVCHFGACPACRRRTADSPVALLVRHMAFVCDEVRKTGKRPIVWADMVSDPAILSSLPEDVLVCEWAYRGATVERFHRLVQNPHRPILGASAIRCSFKPWQMVGDLETREENIRAWHRVAHERPGRLEAVVHTVWGRSRSLAPLYGPWEGWLPAFQIAGNPTAQPAISLTEGMVCLRQGMRGIDFDESIKQADKIAALHSNEPMEEQTLRWWELSLRHHAETCVLTYQTLGREALRPGLSRLNRDANILADFATGETRLLERLDQLENAVSRWLAENAWSDREEYLDSRFGTLRRVLKATRTISPSLENLP